ncbi:MAG: DUF2523 family protein [Desulfobacter sp.]
MSSIINWLSSFWNHIQTALKWGLDGVLYVLKAVLFFAFDGLLTVVYSIVAALDVGSLTVSLVGLWADLPPQLLYVVNATGLPTGLSMIFYAIVIRKLLDLIPAAFTRF